MFSCSSTEIPKYVLYKKATYCGNNLNKIFRNTVRKRKRWFAFLSAVKRKMVIEANTEITLITKKAATEFEGRDFLYTFSILGVCGLNVHI